MRYLVLAFVVVPLAELYLLLVIGRALGLGPTVGLTLVTGLLGGILAKREGTRVLHAWRQSWHQLKPPQDGVVDGLLVLAGGAFLLTPGVLTDITGLALLLRPSRRWIASRLRRSLDRRIAQDQVQFTGRHPFGAATNSESTIETSGEVVNK